MKRSLHLIGLLALAAPVLAGEYVVLGSGLRLHADRHEIDDGTVRVYSGSGIVEMPETAVAGFEQEEVVATAAPPVAPLAPPAASIGLAAVVVPEPQSPEQLAALAAKKYALPDSFVRSVMKA